MTPAPVQQARPKSSGQRVSAALCKTAGMSKRKAVAKTKPAPAEDLDSNDDSDGFFNACVEKKHKCVLEVSECVYVSPAVVQRDAQDANVRLKSCELAAPLAQV